MLIVTVKHVFIERSVTIHEDFVKSRDYSNPVWVFRPLLEVNGRSYRVNIPVNGRTTLRSWLKDFIEQDFEVKIEDSNVPTSKLWRYESSEYEDNSFLFEFVTEPNCFATFLTESTHRKLRTRCSDLRKIGWGDHGCYELLSNFSSFQNAVRQLERSVSQITILDIVTSETARRITYRATTGQEAVLEVKRDPEDFQCFQSQWKDLTNRRVAFSGNVPKGADLEFVKHTPEKLYFRVIDTDATYLNASSDGNGLLGVEYQNGLFIGDDASYWITGLLRGNGGEARISNREVYEKAFADVQREWTYSEPLLPGVVYPFKRLGDASLTPDQLRVLVDGFVVPVKCSKNGDAVLLEGDGFKFMLALLTNSSVSCSVSDPELRSKTFELAIADK